MILGKSRNLSTTNKFDNVDFNISIESAGYAEMFTDTAEEMAALESSLYVADIMLEERCLEGATEQEMETLLEGVMGSFWSRLKATVQKLWAKIKQWFANVKKFFQVLFTHGKEFAKKYKTDIVKAAAKCKGFKYSTYTFKNNGGWKSLTQLNADGGGADATADDALAEATRLINANKSEQSTTELVKIYMREQDYWDKSVDSQAECNKEMRENVFGDGREEFEDFESGSPSVQDMLNVLETGDKALTVINKAESALNRACDKLVRDITKQENEASKEVAKNGGELSKNFTVAVAIVQADANHNLAVIDIGKEALKTAMKDAESILKRLISHKPKKESFELDNEFDGSESILEAALRAL